MDLGQHGDVPADVGTDRHGGDAETPDRPGHPVRAPVALIAGASRGLGLLLAEEVHRQGFRPVLSARSAAELEQASAHLARQGVDVATEVMDVGRADQVDEVIGRVEAELGPIELLLCVAGVIQVAPLTALAREDFVEAVDVMLWGPVNTALAVLPAMRRRGRGRIGIVTSIGGLISAPHLLPYSTAKHGAVGFARGLRSELAGTGITVTTVAPGLMRTGSHVRAVFRGDVQREYAWFATAATMPVLSMDAARAARHILAGVLRGRPVVLLTPLAHVAPRVDALFPRVGAAVLGLTARLLPGWPAERERSGRTEGRQVEELMAALPRGWLRRLTVLGRRAADRNNQNPS
jgi:NAD(P)-dependent dehydrogenase (short-subunit alcohol dehydrogenase family)